jgi:hypothetical protein
LLTLAGIMACTTCGLCSALILQPVILTRLHEAELRPVMERYFAVIQQANRTLDTSQLEEVMTAPLAHGVDRTIAPEIGIRNYYELRIDEFRVDEYSPDRASLFVSAARVRPYHIEPNGDRVPFPDGSEPSLYTLTKVKGVWIVSGIDSAR